MPSIVILAQLLILHDWPLKEPAETGDDLMDDPLRNLRVLLHAYVLLFELF